MAEQRVLQQRVDDRERDRPHGPTSAPGGAEERRAGGALARDHEAGVQRGDERDPDQHDEHEQEDDRARAVAVGEEAERVAAAADDLLRLVGGEGEGERLGLERAALEGGERAELERVHPVVDREQRAVDERDRQRAAAAAAAVGGDVDDPDRRAERGGDEQGEPERLERGQGRRGEAAPARGDAVGGALGRGGEQRGRSRRRSAPTGGA